jgi:RNA polymerase sigma-70 factor (ECF subfamily)
MNSRDIDRVLVARVQGGDKKAFELLVLKYQRKIMRLLAQRIHDLSDLEEVAQETFIKAYRALSQFRGESAFYIWLYRIALRTAHNWLASNGTPANSANALAKECDDALGERPETPQDVTFNHTTAHHDVPIAPCDADVVSDPCSSRVASREIVNIVNGAIQALPEELRMTIMLRETEGMGYAEIAETMACSVGIVQTRIFQARQTVAARLWPWLDRDADRGE